MKERQRSKVGRMARLRGKVETVETPDALPSPSVSPPTRSSLEAKDRTLLELLDPEPAIAAE